MNDMAMSDRSSARAAITPGDIWVRKSDGQETTIIQAPGVWIHNGRVVHKAKRVTRTIAHDFYRKYTPKETAS